MFLRNKDVIYWWIRKKNSLVWYVAQEQCDILIYISLYNIEKGFDFLHKMT